MKQTQKQKIMAHLLKYGSITPLEALREYSIMRLASRVSDLKKEGVPIAAHLEAVTNKQGERVYYARYTLSDRRGGDADI